MDVPTTYVDLVIQRSLVGQLRTQRSDEIGLTVKDDQFGDSHTWLFGEWGFLHGLFQPLKQIPHHPSFVSLAVNDRYSPVNVLHDNDGLSDGVQDGEIIFYVETLERVEPLQREEV